MLARLSEAQGGGDDGVEQALGVTAETLWSEVAGRLKGALNDSAYRTWFGEARPVAISNGELLVAVPNNFTREWIETHFGSLVRAAVSDASSSEISVRFRVDEPLSRAAVTAT